MFKGCPNLIWLQFFGNQPRLTELDLSLPNLEWVAISTPPGAIANVRRFGLGDCPRLRGCTVVGLNSLQSLITRSEEATCCLSQLVQLNIQCAPLLSSGVLKQISIATGNLQTLALSSCGSVDDEAMGFISANCKQLQILQCVRTGIVSPQIGLPEMKFLDLRDNWQLVHLELHAAAVLESLALSNSSISDNTLACIGRACPELRFLWIENCSNLLDNPATKWYAPFPLLPTPHLHPIPPPHNTFSW